MSDAIAFLTAACRAWLGTGPAPVVAPAADPQDLERLAFVHGLEPLLFHLLDRRLVDGESLPPGLAERWEAAYFQNAVFNGEALTVLARLAADCRTAGVEIAVFKGPATLARAYRDPALRPMVDIDVLCREADLPRLLAVAAGAGFADQRASAVHHLSLTHRDLALGLEPHFALYDFLAGGKVRLEELLRGAVELELAGCRFPGLAPVSALVMDVAHLVNHDFDLGLKHFLDLAAACRFAEPPIDAAATEEEARRFGLAPELALAADWVERLFALRPPGRPADLPVEAGADLERLEESLHRAGAYLPALGGVGARPGWRAKASYARRMLFPPAGRLGPAATGGWSARLRARWAHVVASLRRLPRHLAAAGRAPDARPATSIRRRVFERRQDEAR